MDAWRSGNGVQVHLIATVEVEARDEREAQEKAREIVMERVRDLASGGLVTRVKNRIDAWVR
ncbi:hypothetical protein [Thermococcus henrietii]|uniref:hypothetical protein n=1 Tax=Thermococcus henrietii TaxID=2016361 RepID=UPI0011AB6D13|nr:hypothetical protein [Thermococcus henrietii]